MSFSILMTRRLMLPGVSSYSFSAWPGRGCRPGALLHSRENQIGQVVCDWVPESDFGPTHQSGWGRHPSLVEIMRLLQMIYLLCLFLRKRSHGSQSSPASSKVVTVSDGRGHSLISFGALGYLQTPALHLGEQGALLLLIVLLHL